MNAYRRRKNVLPQNIRALLLAAGALSLIILFVRGCLYAKNEGGTGDGNAPLAGEPLRVYDARLKKTVEMDLEEYLVHVVAGEMPASFEAEALKAQAVAARTYTVRRMASHGGTPCGRGGADICTDSTCCQAYQSEARLRENWGSEYAANLRRVRDAVEATAGEILTYDGLPIEALFHSNAGGVTEDAEHVFASAQPYLVSVTSPGDELAAHYTDTVRLTRAEVTKALNKLYPNADVTAKRLDRELKVLSRYASGRVNQISVGDVTLTGRQFRQALDLASANFSLAYSEKYVTVTTVGYGHGVGMSQYGANAMAKAGSGYKEILTHYYTGVEIASLYK
ncbi:MAG: stage II sporulation protein D [Clostridiaceae bacterium]